MNKKLFVGADEAGYGPNLGPLVVAVSLWEVPAELTESRLCEEMANVFSPRAWAVGCTHVPLGDSKKLYQSQSGLKSLEAGLLAMLSQIAPLPTNMQELQGLVVNSEHTQPARQLPPWYRPAIEPQVPVEVAASEVRRLGGLAAEHLQRLGVRLVDMRATVVDEGTFNSAVQRLDSKGQLLSQVTLQAVAAVLDRHAGPAEVFCDRQGGRKNYLPVLMDAMPEHWFRELARGTARCSYRSTSERDIEIHFSVGGDRFPPTALASMLAKYLRERCMQSFNAFWCSQLADLKPTAGYPVDAKRFRDQIAATAERLDLPLEEWWRSR